MSDELLTNRELAKVLKVHYKSINKWVSQKRIEPIKFGNLSRFRLADVQKQLNKNS